MGNSYVNAVVKVKTKLIVSLLEAKKQCNVEDDFLEDDTHLTMLIESARGAAEDYTGVDLADTTNTLEFIRLNTDQIKINEANFDSVTSITQTIDEVETVISSDDYEIQKRRTDFTIMFDSVIDVDKLVIVFKTGFTASNIPTQIKSAILVKINDLYDMERTSYVSGSNFKDNRTFERLLNANVVNRW